MHFKRARLPSDVSFHSGLSLSFSGCFTGCFVTSAPHIFEKCTLSAKPRTLLSGKCVFDLIGCQLDPPFESAPAAFIISSMSVA